MGAKTFALFVDVDNLHQHLRSLHHRSFDPALLLESARQEGEIDPAIAVADWTDLPPELATACETAGLVRVQVERTIRSRETGGRRREFVRDPVDLEILAQMIELLFTDGRDVAGFVLASCDDGAARIAGLIRNKFQKDVVVLGVEGAIGEALQAAATRASVMPLPAVEPSNPEALARLVPLLEALERKKRYLNFKYIRETIVRRLDLPERSFDAAERLLSEAIACGLLLKLKIEDKYNPGQLFTAYSLNRDSDWFKRWGSGEPAPLHDEQEGEEGAPAEGAASEAPATSGAAEGGLAPAEAVAGGPAAPSFGRQERRPQQDRGPDRSRRRDAPPPPPLPPPPPPEGEDEGFEDEGEEAPAAASAGAGRDDRDRRDDRGRGGDDRARGGNDDRGRRRGRRRKGGSGGGGGGGREGGSSDMGGPASIPLSAGGSGHRRGQRNPQLDRVGRAYEAPSRFIHEDSAGSSLPDDEIDEDRILRARGD